MHRRHTQVFEATKQQAAGLTNAARPRSLLLGKRKPRHSLVRPPLHMPHLRSLPSGANTSLMLKYSAAFQ